MFAKQSLPEAVCDLIKTLLTYAAHLQKGKEMGSDETAQTQPVRRAENDSHATDIKGTET
jgi:hypothetical protein